MKPEVVLVKVGGSLITDKRRPGSLRREVLERVAGEIAEAARSRRSRLILGHGSGSFGHVAAARFRLNGGPVGPAQLRGIAVTQDQASRLHRRVIEALERAGALPFSLAPSSFVTATAGRPVAVRLEPLRLALGLRLLPVVYGDVVLDRRWGASICSTENVLLAVARRLLRTGWRVRRAIWIGATDGVYDPSGRRIPRIPAEGIERLLREIGDAEGTDVTGGMTHRLRTAAALVRLGVPSWIVDGRVPGVLARALAGRAMGSRIVPERTRGERTHG